jgi:anion-transporting  ArsA/GET3 family ATPase
VNGPAFAETIFERSRVVVCVGCGGVGKTTIAAALGLEAARRGRHALVLTIDPARRLADALGTGALGNRPRRIPEAALNPLGIAPGGSLSAMMLDMKRTFDDLVERFAESPEACARILENPIYQNVSDALAGSVEYSAMEKVFELAESGKFDPIIVDTPPAQHALDFLEAPQRLLEFLDSRLVAMLIHPAFAAGRLGFRVFQRGARRVLQVMERVSGLSFLEDVSEFLLAFEGMSEGFRERAREVRALLLGEQSSFVLVGGPGSESVRQAERFLDRLEGYGVPLAGVVVNRVRCEPPGGLGALDGGADPPPQDVAALARGLAAGAAPDFPAEAAARAAIAAAKGYAALVRRDARATQPLQRRALERSCFFGRIPEYADDIHDLSGLARIARALLEDGDTGA